jgi:hypothetical protein
LKLLMLLPLFQRADGPHPGVVGTLRPLLLLLVTAAICAVQIIAPNVPAVVAAPEAAVLRLLIHLDSW